MAHARSLVLAGAASFVAWMGAAAQQDGCTLDVQTAPGSESHIVRLPEGGYRIDTRGAIEATCGDSWVRADSATYYDERGILHLYSNVLYRDEGRELESDRATYYASDQRVQARGSVRLRDQQGGYRLEGPYLDYFPETESRVEERIFATGRPHLTFYSDSAPEPTDEPFEVDADRIHLYGESRLAGAGGVVSVRGSMTAYGDSLDLDQLDERFWLLGSRPRIEAEDLVLEGDSISGIFADGAIREIVAWPNASARGSAQALDAPRILVMLEDQLITRVVAGPHELPTETNGPVGGAREPWARSESDEYVLVGDSIDILRPDGRLRTVVAVERARASATEPIVPEDTLFGRDWMVGDTIHAYFDAADPMSAEDSVALERMVASGHARALYHVREEEETDPARFPLNYVLGESITLWFENGEVRQARVVGPGTGVYMEPLPPGADSVAAPGADTIAPQAADTVAPPATNGPGSPDPTVRRPAGDAGAPSRSPSPSPSP